MISEMMKNSRHCLRLCGLFGAICIPILIPCQSEAHPVVFAGGTAVMGHHLGKEAELEVVHSPTWWSGVGLELARHKNDVEVLAKTTALVWRGNFPDFQSNLYLGLGVGREWNKESEPTPVHTNNPTLYQWNAGWDGEDRQIYALTHFAQTYKANSLSETTGKIRLGFAPYKAQGDELTLWGIVEWKPKKSGSDKQWSHEVTPMMRMFYKNALFEIGSSLNGKVAFNYMFHFFN